MDSTGTGQPQGFTLIELSIVLVIIGLIVGAVLVGQDLIKAAQVRATVTQIEKYNTAANTFKEKTGYLPGDIPAGPAAQFGFIARGAVPGQGDGNGIIEAHCSGSTTSGCGFGAAAGEGPVFWVDLSAAHLMDGNFNTAVETGGPGSAVTGSGIDLYLPPAKLGRGNYLYVWSGGYGLGWTGTVATGNNGQNYFGLSAVSQLGGGFGWALQSSPGLTVAQAYAMDQKIDDGLPQGGNVIALYLNGNGGGSFPPKWAAGGGGVGASSGNAPTTAATPGSTYTCYDNSSAASGTPGVAGADQHYSLEISNGSNVNCALSFKFQ